MKKIFLLITVLITLNNTILAQDKKSSFSLLDIFETRLSYGIGFGYNHTIGKNHPDFSTESESELGLKIKPYNLYFARSKKASHTMTPLFDLNPEKTQLNFLKKLIEIINPNDLYLKTKFKNILTYKIRYESNQIQINSLYPFFGIGITSATAEITIEQKKNHVITHLSTEKQRKSGPYFEIGVHAHENRIFVDALAYYHHVKFNFDKEKYPGKYYFAGFGCNFKVGIKI